MFIVDAHLDLAYNALRGRDITQPASQQEEHGGGPPTVGLPDLRAGNVGLICATLFALPSTGKSLRGPSFSTYPEARDIARDQLAYYRKLQSQGHLRLVTRRPDLPGTTIDPRPDRPIPAILLMESADPIQSPDQVQDWWTAGLRALGLAWRKSRYAGGTNHPGPLKNGGDAILRAADHLGIIHDVSHLAEESFWQLLDQTQGPVMASHSNCRSIVPADRQLSDPMIKAVIARHGIIGINLYDEFLLPPGEFKKRRATLADVVAHIEHVCHLAGNPHHVGLGTDMDGGVGRDDVPIEITTSRDLPKLADALASANFPDPDITAILGANFLRFFDAALPA